MSRTFSMNSGSLASLHVSWRCDCKPDARQIRLTAVWLSPRRRRHLRRRPLPPAVGRPGLQRLEDHFLNLLIGDLPRLPGPRLVNQPVQTRVDEPPPPLADRRTLVTARSSSSRSCRPSTARSPTSSRCISSSTTTPPTKPPRSSAGCSRIRGSSCISRRPARPG